MVDEYLKKNLISTQHQPTYSAIQTKHPVICKRLFLANIQVAHLDCSAESVARYVTGTAALLSGLKIESEIDIPM